MGRMIALRRAALATAWLALQGCGEAPAPNAATSNANDCGGPVLPISQIQGRSLASPLLGQRVTVEAVVTARAPGTGGVYVQEEQADRDGDPQTSEALLVLGEVSALAPGQRVRLEGVVGEQGEPGYTHTVLAELGALRVCGEAEMPAPYIIEHLPLTADDWESLEHMRVEVEPAATLIDPDRWSREQLLLVSLSGQQWAPTERDLPGDDARRRMVENARARLLLDPHMLAERKGGSGLQRISARHPWRAGTQVERMVGIFQQSTAGYGIVLTEPPQVTQAPRPAGPPTVGGNYTVLSFNTGNLFNGDGRKDGFPTPRGARAPAEWDRQLAKHVSVLRSVSADVVALMELENDPQDGEHSAEQQLVARLNQALGKQGDYKAVVAPEMPLGSDQIRVGLIYRANRVEAVEPARALLQAPFDRLHRAPLLQTFRTRKGDHRFSVVVNHFKSKGGCNNAPAGDHDREDGQSCFNAARVAAARALADWVDAQGEGPDNEPVLLLGDFNAHAAEDPIRLLEQRGYARVRVAEPAYSFLWQGAVGSLDHALASLPLRKWISGAAVWHINADEAEDFSYRGRDTTPAQAPALYQPDPFRSSDHDPLLIGLDFASAPSSTP